MASAAEEALIATALALLGDVPPDGEQWNESVQVYANDGVLYWSVWTEGSTFGLGGQIDQMSEQEAREFMEEQPRKGWVSKGSYAEQIEGLCQHYAAPACFTALSDAGLEGLDGKGVSFFKQLELALRDSWEARGKSPAEMPAMRGFVYAPGTWGSVIVHP